MKGLLLKDVYQMWYYTRMLILAAVLVLYAASWRLSVVWYGKVEQ